MNWWEELGYPPFEPGKNGYPRTGVVIKHYRQEKNMSQAELAKKLKSRRQTVVGMETQDGKLDWEKRLSLCYVLSIPPALLGVVTLEEIYKLLDQKKKNTPMPASKRNVVNVEEHNATIESALRQIQHGDGATSLPVLHSQAISLYQYIPHVNEQSRKQIYTLLFSYHGLMCRIYQEVLDFDHSIGHLNYAKDFDGLLDSDELRVVRLIATSQILKRMGRTEEALRALNKTEFYAKSTPPYLSALRCFYQAPLLGTLAQSESDKLEALRTADMGRNMAYTLPSSDYAYTLDFSPQGAHISRGATLNAIGWGKSAVDELQQVQCRQGSWWQVRTDIEYADAYRLQGENGWSTIYAMQALTSLKKLVKGPSKESATITGIYDQLAQRGYHGSDMASFKQALGVK